MNRNTITRQITTTEENIRRLMESLEENDFRTDELANCQNKVDKLFGKLSDNHTVLTSEVREMLDDLRAGKVSPDALEKLLVSEREKVSYSLQLADSARKSLDDVMSFVQHFVNDVKKGKPVPKDSFASLYNELDTIADSMDSMAKVHRSKDIQKLKRIMQQRLEEKKVGLLDEGIVSLKHIVTESNREAKMRHQKRPSQGNNRTTIMPIGSLAKPRSSRDLMGGGDLSATPSHRLATPDRSELSSRGGSPPGNMFATRTGTAGSVGGGMGPTSPGKGVGGFDKTGQSIDEYEGDGLTMHGRHSSIIKSTRRAKKQGKQEKRLASSVIYQHTDDDSSIGSNGGFSLNSSGPLALADFVPADAKKLQVNQSVQTDDVAIGFNNCRLSESPSAELQQGSEQDSNIQQDSATHQDNITQQVSNITTKAVSSSGGGGGGGGKKSGGKGRKAQVQKKDGKSPSSISMVSARRGSRDKGKGGHASAAVSFKVESSSAPLQQGDQLLTADSDGATQEYFQNYIDKPKTDDSNESEEASGGLANMSTEEAKLFLVKKEQQLLSLEEKLRKQQDDMAAVINVKVAEEVAKTLKKQAKQVSTQQEVPGGGNFVVGSTSSGSGDGEGSLSRPGSSDESRQPSGEGNEEVTEEKEGQIQSPLQLEETAGIAAGEGAKRKKKTSEVSSTKPPVGARSALNKKGEGGKRVPKNTSGASSMSSNNSALQLSMDKLIERIINFLPGSEEGGSKFFKVPVHNIPRSDSSMNDSEDFKLPPIGDPASQKGNKSDRKGNAKNRKGSGWREDSSTMAVTGVRAGGIFSSENSQAGDDDSLSVLSTGSQEIAMQRMSRSPIHHPDLQNEIWIPPPGNLNKKIYNTICIFPLHTVDQSTSTDDLNPIVELPLTMEALELNIPKVKETITDHYPSGEKSPPSQESPIIPRGLSHVEAISRPSTRGGGDTIVISRPITGTSARNPAAGTDSGRWRGGGGSGQGAGGGSTQSPVTLEDVTAELKKQGTTEGNPLLQLYLLFYKDLDVQCRHHLLAAASGVSMDASRYASKEGVEGHKGSPYSIPTLQGMSDMFEVVAEEVSKLEYTSYYAMQALLQTEQTINDLILIATSREELTDSFYFHLRESSKKLGEVKIAEAWVSMLLHDSRAIFTRTRALGIDPVLIGPQFSIAYQSFLSCQGSTLALKKKLTEVHALLQKYLAVPIIHAETMPVSTVDTERLEQHCEMLRERCEELEEGINDIKDENEELRSELQIMDSQLDRTPGALLFYSVLHNPKLPEIVANHIQVLLGVKSTIEGNAHFDFIALKRRLEMCLHGLPAMQQFFKKYNSLHKKWAASRAKMFLDRRQIGGDADNHYVCPICNIDSRRAEVDMECPLVNTAPKNSSSSGALATITKMKTNKKGIGSASPSSNFGF